MLSVSYSYRVLLCQLGLERPDGMAPFRSEQAAPCQGAGTVHICKCQLFISKVVPTHFHKVFSLPWPTHSRILMSKVTAGRPRSCHTSKCAAQRFARSSRAAGATGMRQCLLRSLLPLMDQKLHLPWQDNHSAAMAHPGREEPTEWMHLTGTVRY